MGFPKLVVLVLVFAAVWSCLRWFNQGRSDLPQHRAAPRRAIDTENLTACRICGAYVADGSRRCGRRDCPLPR
jgi:hypothetical protein